MKYLFLMFYKYYKDGKETKSTAYISALGVVSIYIFVFFLNVCKILNIDFKIMFWSKNVFLNYLLIGIVLLPINIFLYFIFPPEKVKALSLNFKYNIYKSIFLYYFLLLHFFIICKILITPPVYR